MALWCSTVSRSADPGYAVTVTAELYPGDIKSVLLSDGGKDALARGRQFDTPARRAMYELLTARGTASQRRLLNAALKDSDAVIRARAIRPVATDPDFEDRAAILEQFLRGDRVPAVRRLALTVLSEHMPQRISLIRPGHEHVNVGGWSECWKSQREA